MEGLIPASATGQGRPKPQFESPLRYFVIDSGDRATAAAIQVAGTLAKGLNAEMTLLAAVEVPLPLPVQEPPVAISFLEDRLRELAAHAQVPGRVELLLCRDRRRAIRDALPAGSLVVIGGRSGWFRRSARQFVAALRRDGHKVFFVEESGKK